MPSYHMRPDGKKMAQVSQERTILYPKTLTVISSIPCHNLALYEVLPISLKYATLDAFRYRHKFLEHASDIGAMMQLWAAAASALPYTVDIGERVIDALLQMAFQDVLRPHIPVTAWGWLRRRPALRPGSPGLELGTKKDVVRTVRKLGDIGLITSYLIVIWSEWSDLDPIGCEEMYRLVREELSGIRATGCRADLIQRLDYVLSWFNQGWQYVWPNRPSPTEAAFLQKKEWYEGFRRALLEVEEETMNILAGTYAKIVVRLCLLTYARTCRISLHRYVCTPPSLPVVGRYHSVGDTRILTIRGPLYTLVPVCTVVICNHLPRVASFYAVIPPYPTRIETLAELASRT